MNILLDTHVLVWTQQDSPKLGKRARKAILDPSHVLWISSVTALEISRLVDAGRLELGLPVHEWFQKALISMQAKSCFLDHSIAIESYSLPAPFHPDPADRMLVATARLQGMRLMTADERILAYKGVSSLHASK